MRQHFISEKQSLLMGRDGNFVSLVLGQKVRVIEINPSGLCMIAFESERKWIWRGKVWRDYLSLALCIEWRAVHLRTLENAAENGGGNEENENEWVEASEGDEPQKKRLGPYWERNEPRPRYLQDIDDAYDDEKIPVADSRELEEAIEDEKGERS